MTEFVDDARRYRLESRIATGGMGEVWRAEDTTLNRAVAVKLLKAEYADDPHFRSRFEVEARHAAALHHPGVAAVFDFGAASATDGSGVPRPYLVMELVEGQPLSALLRPGSPMDVDVATDLIAQAAAAVGAAHTAGIVHRDIKPGNLIITPDRKVKITDFGIARATEGMALTEPGQVLGTPQYISPEQAQGLPATAASDVYSLGVLAFECLAGRRPFHAETPVATALAHVREPVPDLPTDVPAALAGVVRRCLAKEPEERYADGNALAAALRDPSAAPATAATAVVPTPVPQASGAETAVLTGLGPVEADEGIIPADDRRPGVPWWAVGLVVLIALAAAFFAWRTIAASGDDDPLDDPSETPSVTETPTEEATDEPTEQPTQEPQTVVVDPSRYIGRQLGGVRAELEGLGLRVAVDEVTNPGDQTAGTVRGVNPSGELERGDRVTVSVWGPAPEPEPEPTPEPTPTPTPEPEPEPEPTPNDETTTPDPEDDQG